jgi:hypothetical protein
VRVTDLYFLAFRCSFVHDTRYAMMVDNQAAREPRPTEKREVDMAEQCEIVRESVNFDSCLGDSKADHRDNYEVCFRLNSSACCFLCYTFTGT